jgi:hypothetical protein
MIAPPIMMLTPTTAVRLAASVAQGVLDISHRGMAKRINVEDRGSGRAYGFNDA